MKVRKENPFISVMGEQSLEKIDFCDTFSVTNHKNSLKEIAKLIFGRSPVWIQKLFILRNLFIKIVGIKEQKPKEYTTEYRVGGYIGLFKIYEILDNEIILGLDDSHLNYRTSIYNTLEYSHNIKVTTLVKYNNTKGKIYMTIIKPFHELVVKNMLKQAYNK